MFIDTQKLIKRYKNGRREGSARSTTKETGPYSYTNKYYVYTNM